MEAQTPSEEEVNLDRYAVERTTKLFAAPSSQATVLGDLYPNQIVILTQKNHKWIKVQHYDFMSEKMQEGWVTKKYLRNTKR